MTIPTSPYVQLNGGNFLRHSVESFSAGSFDVFPRKDGGSEKR